ncbi:MAG: TonB-dependent receptor [Cephaloticoccus sp.]|nr:TonB-dependent receptor [Cephaloticoccus sp.]
MYSPSKSLCERSAVRAVRFTLFASLLVTSVFAQTSPAPTDTKDEVITLDEFQVSTTSDKGYRAGNSVSATRIDTAIKDLPFSVSAFTEQFIEDIGANELLDVVKFAPGVTSGAKEFTQGNNRYSIRGFDGDVTPQRNGFVGSRYVDSGNIERVEVVKGPASLLYGQITPGGTVNYITKRPKDKSYVKVKAQVGTDNYRRVDVDINEAVSDGRFKARLVGAYEKSPAWADPSGGDSRLVAGSFEAKVGKNSSLILDFESFRKNQEPMINMSPNMSVSVSASSGNFARVADRARAQAYIDVGNLNLGFIGFAPLPDDFNYPSSNDYRRSRFDSLYLQFNQKIGENWRARLNFGYDEFKISNKLTGLAEFTTTPSAAYLATKNRFDYVAELQANPAAVLADASKTASSLLTRRKRLEESSGDTLSWQAELTGLVELGEVKLRPLFGAFLSNIGTGSFRRESTATPSASTPNEATTPIQHFQPWNYNDPTTWVHNTNFNPDDIPNVNSFNDASGEESAVYALVNASLLNERLILIGGARYNKTWTINTDFRPTVTGGSPSVGSKFEATKTTPQVGAGFKLRPDLLLFASYSESFFIEDRSLTDWNPSYNPLLPTSSSNPVTRSTPAKPTTGSGYEVGVKTDFLDGRVSSTVSLFHLERENRVLRFRESAPDGSFPTLTRQGTVDQSEGVEVELTWSPTDNWQVYATVSKMDIKTVKAIFPALPTNADPVYQAAYVAAFEEAKALILNAVPEGSAEQLATLWTRYNFEHESLQGWWVGGGFVYTGDKAQRTANPTLFLEASTIYDLTVGRDWKMDGRGWSATLAVKNLADTVYYNANQSRGMPRRVVLGVSTKF